MEILKFKDSFEPKLFALFEPFGEYGEAELTIKRSPNFIEISKFIIDRFNVDNFIGILKAVEEGNGGLIGETILDYDGVKLEVTSSFYRNGTIAVLWIEGMENTLWLDEAEASRLIQALETLKKGIIY